MNGAPTLAAHFEPSFSPVLASGKWFTYHCLLPGDHENGFHNRRFVEEAEESCPGDCSMPPQCQSSKDVQRALGGVGFFKVSMMDWVVHC